MNVIAIINCDNLHFRVFQNIKQSYVDFSFESKLVYTIMNKISKPTKYKAVFLISIKSPSLFGCDTITNNT